MKALAVLVIAVGLCLFAAGLAALVGVWFGLIAGGVLLAVFGAFGIEVDDE